LNLADNQEHDGGTVVVPKFPQHFDAWRRKLGRFRDNRVGQRRRGNSFVFADNNDNDDGDDNYHQHQASSSSSSDPIVKLARRVPLREGSLLLWDMR
jgi:hypothetical protein